MRCEGHRPECQHVGTRPAGAEHCGDLGGDIPLAAGQRQWLHAHAEGTAHQLVLDDAPPSVRDIKGATPMSLPRSRTVTSLGSTSVGATWRHHARIQTGAAAGFDAASASASHSGASDSAPVRSVSSSPALMQLKTLASDPKAPRQARVAGDGDRRRARRARSTPSPIHAQPDPHPARSLSSPIPVQAAPPGRQIDSARHVSAGESRAGASGKRENEIP